MHKYIRRIFMPSPSKMLGAPRAFDILGCAYIITYVYLYVHDPVKFMLRFL